MVFSIAIVALIVAAIFFQTIHGLFSSFIMMMLTILSAALALGMYENLYYGMVREYAGEYGEAIALVGLFAVFLLLLRVLFDQMIGGNMIFPAMVDRIGGAACGIVTALVTIGMLAIGFQLLPFDAAILGYKRMDGVERKRVAINPDGFTVGLVSHLSSNALSGRQSLESFHPDYLLGIHACRSVQKESVLRPPPEALWVLDSWKPGNVVLRRAKEALAPSGRKKQGPGFKTLKPMGGKEWRTFRVQVKQGQDSDGRHRFTRYSWRLVGTDENGEPAEFYATAYKRGGNSAETGKYIAFDPDEFVAPQVGKQPHFDIVFGVPPTFTPRFLEYKRTARYAISKTMLESNEPPIDERRRGKKPSPSGKKKEAKKRPPANKPPAKPPDGSEKSGQSDAGADKKVGRVDAGKGGTDTRYPFRAEQTNAIPIFLSRSAYSGQNATTSGTEFGSGHVTADLPAKDKIKIGTVQTFRVPKGVEMWQVSSDASRGRSLFGKAMSFAKGVTAQYRVTDDKGKTYFAIGEVRIARKDKGKGGRVEIIYRPEMADSTPDQALRGDRRIGEQQLQTDGSQVVFLFLLPPGEKVTSFKASKREYPIVY